MRAKPGNKGKDIGKAPDFGLMAKVSQILLQEDNDSPELVPSEALEAI